MDRLDGANAPALTKKVQHHASIITTTVTAEKEQDTKQVCSRGFLQVLFYSYMYMYFYRSGKIQEKKYFCKVRGSRKFYLFERSQGRVKSCLNLVEALFVMRNADPFWQLIDSHKHFYFPCVIQVTL